MGNYNQPGTSWNSPIPKRVRAMKKPSTLSRIALHVSFYSTAVLSCLLNAILNRSIWVALPIATSTRSISQSMATAMARISRTFGAMKPMTI